MTQKGVGEYHEVNVLKKLKREKNTLCTYIMPSWTQYTCLFSEYGESGNGKTDRTD